jgi:hypothetical protein
MYRLIPPFLVSFLTLGLVSSAQPMSERPKCDARDELIATVYNDPFFSKPENHEYRNQLISKIARDERICEPRD